MLCFDAIFSSFNELSRRPKTPLSSFLDLDIEFTEEFYELTAYERDVIDAYNSLEYIDVTFKVLNNDDEDINRLIDDSQKAYFIVSREHGENLEKIRIRYHDGILRILNRANKKNIDYICYSDNYNNFIKLTKDKQEELKKYIRDLKIS